MSGFRTLFRLIMFPRPLAPKQWERPYDEEEYEQELYWEGFIVPSKWHYDDLTNYPTIIKDLDTLEGYLLPVFWEFNQKAIHFQSRYFWYQRIFLVSALLTTIISVTNSYIHTIDSSFQILNLFGLVIEISDVNFLLGICTALISARASYFTLLADNSEPRQGWARYRSLTEELRIMYFKFLAHTERFSGDNRIQVLREEVLNVRRQALNLSKQEKNNNEENKDE